MRRTPIRYKAKPDAADHNAELVKAVFAELRATQPEGVLLAWDGDKVATIRDFRYATYIVDGAEFTTLV